MSLVSFRPILKPFKAPNVAPAVQTRMQSRSTKGQRKEFDDKKVKHSVTSNTLHSNQYVDTLLNHAGLQEAAENGIFSHRMMGHIEK